MAKNARTPKYVPRWRVWLWKLTTLAAFALIHGPWAWWPLGVLGLAVFPLALFEWAFAAIKAEPRVDRPAATHS
jgi:hypothetical protein